jgi:hypothetical protein
MCGDASDADCQVSVAAWDHEATPPLPATSVTAPTTPPDRRLVLLLGCVALTIALPVSEKGSTEHGKSTPAELLGYDDRPLGPVVWGELDNGLTSQQNHLGSRGPAELPEAEARPTRRLGARRRLGEKDPFGTCTGGCTNFQKETQWNQMMESIGLGCRCSGSHPYCRRQDGDCYTSEACKKSQ